MQNIQNHTQEIPLDCLPFLTFLYRTGLTTNGYFCIPKTMTYFKSFPKAAPHSPVHIGDPNPSRQPAEVFALTILPLSFHSLSVLPMQPSSSTPYFFPSPRLPAHFSAVFTTVAPNRTAREYMQHNYVSIIMTVPRE